MSEESRNIKNYPYKTFNITDTFSGDIISFKAISMRLNLYKDTGSLSIEVWKSDADFNSRAASSPNLSKTLPITADIIAGYKELFQMIDESALKFLELTDEFKIETLDIDLNSLRIGFSARHKTRMNRVCSDATANWEEFEEIKKLFPQIVEGFIGFAFSYMKSNEVLAKFE